MTSDMSDPTKPSSKHEGRLETFIFYNLILERYWTRYLIQ